MARPDAEAPARRIAPLAALSQQCEKNGFIGVVSLRMCGHVPLIGAARQAFNLHCHSPSASFSAGAACLRLKPWKILLRESS